MAEVSQRLVQDFDVDGIYLDSWGWQSNWPMKTEADGVLYSPAEYNEGVLELTRRVRKAIRSVKPEAVVLGESTSGALGRCWDGGLSADFAWLAPQNKNRIVASPVRYAVPELNIYSNGRDLNELNQVFAAGHHLALLNSNLPDASYVRKLVQIRQTYKDALIYGRQVRQPQTGDDETIAYLYEGRLHEILLVVNIAPRPYAGQVAPEIPGGSQWRDLFDGRRRTAEKGLLALELSGKTFAL